MQSREKELREEIVRICRRVYEKGWVAANDGNVTVRLNQQELLCTPTAMSKSLVQPEDLIVCDLDGNKLGGYRQCTSEIGMHTAIYRLRPDVTAVVHAHPPVATGFAVAGRALDKALLPEVIVQLGAIPLARYGLPGTPALAEGMLPFIPTYDAILLENHGCTTLGADLWQAFFRMETVEHLARVTFVAEALGGANALPRVEVDKLFAARERYNVSRPAGPSNGIPLAAEDLPASQCASTNYREKH
jgi:L-fuculose-phosphate aldolase